MCVIIIGLTHLTYHLFSFFGFHIWLRTQEQVNMTTLSCTADQGLCFWTSAKNNKTFHSTKKKREKKSFLKFRGLVSTGKKLLLKNENNCHDSLPALLCCNYIFNWDFTSFPVQFMTHGAARWNKADVLNRIKFSFTCQKMVSIVLPRKPSLVSDDRSLGPRIVMNSSKSTCPSPDTRKHSKLLTADDGLVHCHTGCWVWMNSAHLLLRYYYLQSICVLCCMCSSCVVTVDEDVKVGLCFVCVWVVLLSGPLSQTHPQPP